jgi:D-alanine-D-alanine ligase
MSPRTLRVSVVLGDPELPYAYGPDGRFSEDDLAAVEELKLALAELDGYEVSYLDDHATLLDSLLRDAPDLVLNLCDTGFRNRWEHERNIPALLEILGIPYTGSDPAGIVLSNDKTLVSAAARLRGVRVPDHTFIDLTADPPVTPLAYPALIKPNVSAGSFGITDKSVVHDRGEALAYLAWLAPQLSVPEAISQDYLPGDEYTVGLIGNPDEGFTVLPPLRIDWGAPDPSLPRVLTYASKADPDSPYWNALS